MPIATSQPRRLILALALTLGACGGDDDGDDTGAVDSTGDTNSTTNSTTNTTNSTTTPDDSTGPSESSGPAESSGPDESSGAADSSSGEAVCQTDVCATYGAAVPLVASQITDAAAADPQFEGFFAPLVAEGEEAVNDFKESLANFISDAYGCTEDEYDGPTMQEAHMGMNITQSQYDAFVALIAGILLDNGVPEDDVNLCFAPALTDPAFSATIVGQ